MTKIMLRSSLAALAALVLSTGAQAQECLLEDVIDDRVVCVELPNGIPAPGRELRVEVTVDGPVLGEGSVFYRPTGTDSTQYVRVVPRLEGNRYSAAIPGEAVTIRGLDLWGTYTSEDGEEFTYPEGGRDVASRDPAHVTTFIGSFTSPVELSARTYRMISVAADVGASSVADVLEDDLGAPNVARWRLLRWNPASASYDEFPSGTDSFRDGAAFWIITADGGTFDIDASESTNPGNGDQSLPPGIALEPGANQIGNPYAFPVAWDDVLEESGLDEGSVGRPMAFDGISPYVPVDVLEPWTGYFVENNTGQALSLTVPDREAGLAEAPVRDDEPTFAVRVSAASGAYRDTLNVMGFAPEAQPGRDRFDLAEMPPIGEHLRVTVVDGRAEWMRSIKPLSTDGAAWDLDVTATPGLLDDGPREVSLSLLEMGVRPVGFELFVIDRDRGTAVALVDGTIDVTLSADQPVRHLRLIAGTEAFAQSESEGAPLSPTTFALAPTYPNPFASQTTIRYRLESRGTATLEVFDLLGRRVRVLADGGRGAGPHTAEWDGRDAAGRLVANGVYLVRLRTGDASATRRVSVLR